MKGHCPLCSFAFLCVVFYSVYCQQFGALTRTLSSSGGYSWCFSQAAACRWILAGALSASDSPAGDLRGVSTSVRHSRAPRSLRQPHEHKQPRPRVLESSLRSTQASGVQTRHRQRWRAETTRPWMLGGFGPQDGLWKLPQRGVVGLTFHIEAVSYFKER